MMILLGYCIYRSVYLKTKENESAGAHPAVQRIDLTFAFGLMDFPNHDETQYNQDGRQQMQASVNDLRDNLRPGNNAINKNP